MNILKELREEIGISQGQLAVWSGVSKSYIKKLESGERSFNSASLEIICKFAIIFQVPMEYFVDMDMIGLKPSFKEYFDIIMEEIYDCYRLSNRRRYKYDGKGPFGD